MKTTMFQKSHVRFDLHKLTLAFALATAASVIVHAQTINQSENSSLFGNLSQYNSAVASNQATACEPTSVSNGLQYLDAVNGDTLFASTPATYTNLNALAAASGTTGGAAGGTPYGPGVTGMVNYMLNTNTTTQAVGISGQYAYNTWGAGLPANNSLLNFNMTTPSATFLGNALQAQDAVQLAIWWGTYNTTNNTFTPTPGNGTHEIDLYSLNLVNGTGTAGLVVPESAAGTLNDVNATAQTIPSATVQTVAFNGGNYLYFTYGEPVVPISGVPGETDPSNGLTTPLDSVAAPGAGSFPTGLIVADYVEAAPEPSSFLLGGIALAVFALLARRRIRA